MIDIHSHVIPGIDDGSKDIDMTIEMLKCAGKNGTDKIIATPHYALGYGEATIDEVKKYVEDINEILLKQDIDIKVYAGQEVYFSENIVNDYIENKIGTLNDSRYMLIEFDMINFEKNMFDMLYELQLRDIVPIIAHPERYRYFINEPTKVNKLIDEGYLFQLNAGSIYGKFGSKVKKTAEIFSKNKIYSFIGSDAHNITSRTTDMTKALEIIEKNYISEINHNSEKIISNEEIVFRGRKITKKSFFSFFSKS